MVQSELYFDDVVVLGASGGIGGLFKRKLETACTSVAGFDLQGGKGVTEADVCNPSEEMLLRLSFADLVIICLPDPLGAHFGKQIRSLAGPESLTVRCCSVIGQENGSDGVVAINLLFAPDLGFTGRPVLLEDQAETDKISRLKKMLESWGANVVMVSRSAHDEIVAHAQAAVHSLVLAYALNLARSTRPFKRCPSPPPSKTLAMLAARILQSDPNTYWSIQHDNPFAAAARKSLIDALLEIDSAARQNNRAAFGDLWSEASKGFGSDLPALASQCGNIFRLIK